MSGPTIGDVLNQTLGMRDNYHGPSTPYGETTLEICAALNLPPDALAANIVALQAGQHVVEWAKPYPGAPALMAWQGVVEQVPVPPEPYPWFIPGNGWRWVVIRSFGDSESEET